MAKKIKTFQDYHKEYFPSKTQVERDYDEMMAEVSNAIEKYQKKYPGVSLEKILRNINLAQIAYEEYKDNAGK